MAEAELAVARESLKILKTGPTPTELAVQSAAVEEAAARLALAKAHLAECTVCAPFHGMITTVHVRRGDLATPRSPLLQMYAHDSLVIRFVVPEAHAATVRPGLPLRLTVDALNGLRLSGEVTRIYPELDETMRTRTVEAKLLEPAELAPHMFVRLDLELQRTENAVLLPAEAVFTTLAGARFVFVVDDGEAILQAAKIRLRPRLMTTITTMIGFVPLALKLGEGADMLPPMAIGAIGGLATEALVALSLMPCLYVLCARRPRNSPVMQAGSLG